uniref:Uncharacterized protein n=1 Tax=Chionoecetes opilio bacilliform virus TaxID=1825681 RepID=A0A1Q3DLJ8_9VIRU|nr:hypothetical protein [Chionoecetes opilio bacilliform virus]GAV93203.1 hypothetical protein SCV_083 [Chionoecetes opilio bacilliform virus]
MMIGSSFMPGRFVATPRADQGARKHTSKKEHVAAKEEKLKGTGPKVSTSAEEVKKKSAKKME